MRVENVDVFCVHVVLLYGMFVRLKSELFFVRVSRAHKMCSSVM